MKTTISSKGQLVLPAKFRDLDQIRPGQKFEVKRVAPGQYLLRQISIAAKTDIVDWLLACPVKDWFEPLPSEMTDEL